MKNQVSRGITWFLMPIAYHVWYSKFFHEYENERNKEKAYENLKLYTSFLNIITNSRYRLCRSWGWLTHFAKNLKDEKCIAVEHKSLFVSKNHFIGESFIIWNKIELVSKLKPALLWKCPLPNGPILLWSSTAFWILKAISSKVL